MRAERSILITTTVLFLCALAIVLLDGMPRPEQDDANRRLQRAFRGFGLGAAIRGDWGFAGFDPRVDGERETDLWPIPGGYAYSPEEGMMGSGRGSAGNPLPGDLPERNRTARNGRS